MYLLIKLLSFPIARIFIRHYSSKMYDKIKSFNRGTRFDNDGDKNENYRGRLKNCKSLLSVKE